MISCHPASNHAMYGDRILCAIASHNVSNICAIPIRKVPNRARFGDRMRCAITGQVVRRLTTGNIVTTDRWNIRVGWLFRCAL